ncbi:hypothetical protein RB608_11945 [Nocardioides sp. LHD-245]|uniref:hypothetical protein n=1 Tax=Nocardioides sp. LHD-245 TaxID=3051387 RepID=UPI0027DFADC9|nr:hypothetical protein [Nocardioides sp. LHD-245]
MSAIGGRKVNVKITGGTPASLLFAGYLTNARWNAADADSDTLTFQDANSGSNKDWSFQGSALQDDGADNAAFFTFVENNVGTDVYVTLMPQGNTTASTTAPHRAQTCTVAEFDGDFFGGEANKSQSFKNTFDYSWAALAKPVKVTA